MSTIFPQPPAQDGASTQQAAPARLHDALAPAYRVPRVDLLPPEILSGRRFRRTQVRACAGLVVLLLGMVGGYAVAVRDADEAAEGLALEQARTAELQAEQVQYARAPQVYAQVESAQTALLTAMANDVRWYTYLADLSVTAPDGVWFSDITASVAPPTGAPAVGDPLAAPGAAAAVGTISVTGTVREETQVADWLEVLDATPGLAGATTTSITRTAVGEQPVFPFVSTASITGDALSHRFEQETD